ncbi:MAG TPA: hypothetical protein VG734_04050 [Lacunisphaera sp.]|nr:hypothetical protein [Lacunisphaera sp.]
MNASIFPLPGNSRRAVTAAVAASVLIASGALAQVNGSYSAPVTPGERPASLPSLGSEAQTPGTHMMRQPDGPSRPQGPHFLPAVLPVLGTDRPPDIKEPLAAGYPRQSAGEPYFMAEGNLIANQLLSDKRAEGIASYRTARLTLLTELQLELARGPEVSREDRERALAQLASVQTPRLLELEAEAERIRRDLTRLEPLKIVADDIGKLVPKDEAPMDQKALADVRMLLSAAVFREGFSPDQRRLLEEMAQEARFAVEPQLASARAVFFWPAGARIVYPDGLAPAAAKKFEEFQRRKEALKKELRRLVEKERYQLFNIDRTEDFEHLAAAQAKRFAELDALADELRPALAALADATTKPATAAVPADLVRQVVALADQKAQLQREVNARLTEFRRALPGELVEFSRENGGLMIAITTENGSQLAREEALVGINAFNQEVANRYAALSAERDAVRTSLTRYLVANPGAKPGQTADQLAADILADHKAREYRASQTNYAAAVFAPGLSPAQRRLLLAAATVDSVR